MIQIRFEDVVGIAGNEYRLVSMMPSGFLLQGLEHGGEPEFFSSAEIVQVEAEGLLSIRAALRPASPFNRECARYSRALCEGFVALKRAG